MKKRHLIICGWCYAQIKDSMPMRLLGGFHGRDRCEFCRRPVEFNAYVVEVGGDDEPEDNIRRPANYKGSMPSI